MKKEDTDKRINELEKEISNLWIKIKEKESKWDFFKSFDDYENYLEPESSMIMKLDAEVRLISPFELEDLPRLW